MDEEATLVRICNECAAEMPEGARFCPNCGADSVTGEARGDPAMEREVHQRVRALCARFPIYQG